MADIPAIPDSLRDALRRKARLPADYYGDAIGQVRAAGFTVSGLASLDQVQDVLDSLRDALAKGQSFASWKKSALASGKDFGLAPHRLETIFRNNVQAWYAAGQAEAIRRNKDAFPYLRYSAVGDARTRPAHMALDGLILPVDHPFWRTNYPPCGHNCRCTVIPMTEKAALAAIGAAREEGRVIDQVPADAAPPPPGWDYDRLQIPPANPQDKARWHWSERDQTWKPVRRAPLEGLERAVERRQAVCVPRMFARDRSLSLWCHGDGVEVLRRYGTSLRRSEPMPDPQRLAQTLDLPQGMKPEEYIAAFMAEFGSGAKGTVLHESLPGITLAVSRAIFTRHGGGSKLTKEGRNLHVRYLAHGIKNPDEVWYVRESGAEKLYYLARMNAGNESIGVQAVFQWDGRGWEPVTGYQGRDAGYVEGRAAWARKNGVLLYRKE